ncbi:MAG: hypothetical protein Q7S15_01240, partial [bacterium]|nr:hypothetical protein [bacterium]
IIDVVVLDFEGNMSNWVLGNRWQTPVYEESNYYAIESDPRFAEAKQELIALGYPATDSLRPVWEWIGKEHYLIWNEFVGRRVADYLNEAVYGPIKKYYPDVKFSNYNYAYHSSAYPVPDFHGHKGYKYGTGAHVGTHQTASLYGELGQVTKQKLDGVNLYAATPFNSFRFELNKARASMLSSLVPYTPWFPNKEYWQNLMNQSNFYQEMILHTLLSGADNILFWNPKTSESSTPASDKIMNDTIAEFNAIAGFSDKRTIVTELVPWGSDYALSGMQTGGKTVWRFTPVLETGETIQAMIITENPVTVKSKSQQLVFENATIHRPQAPVSAQGIWIVQEGNAGHTIRERSIIDYIIARIIDQAALIRFAFGFIPNSLFW